MEVRPRFEREQKRSAARVQNVDHCFGVRKHLAVSVCGKTTFWADLHFSTGCQDKPFQAVTRSRWSGQADLQIYV